VSSGAALQSKEALPSAMKLDVNGGGISSDGACEISGHQLLERRDHARLSFHHRLRLDTLTLSGNIDSGGFLLTIQGAVNTTATGYQRAGGLTKAGSGTRLTLSGANTYTDATTISAGALTVTNSSALGTTANGTTVAAARCCSRW